MSNDGFPEAFEDAYSEGFSAFEMDKALFDNPYPDPSVEHEGWEAGWEDAQQLHDKARRDDLCE